MQAAQGARHVDAVGATVATARDQLVAQVLDFVGVLALVAMCSLGDDAHTAVLVAHVAVRHVGIVFLVETQVVGIQVLVAALQDHVALVGQVGVCAVLPVAFNGSGLVSAVRARLGGVAAACHGQVSERGDDVLHRA